MLPYSINRVLSDTLTYFPLVPAVNVCLETSPFSVISEIQSVLIVIIGVKFYYLPYEPYVQYCRRQFSVFLHISLPMIFLVPFFKNIYGYWKLPLTGFTGLLFGDLRDVQQHSFSLPVHNYLVHHFSFFVSSHINWYFFRWY